GSNWFLAESEHFFSFIENVSARISDNGHFASVFDDSPILSFTEEDFISTHSLVPTLLYIYEGTPIPRMNMTMSQQLWGFPHAAIRPFGILADVQETPGGEDFTYEFLFITDAMGNNIVATDQDEWLADFGEWGSGIGQFAGPHGICSKGVSGGGGKYMVADMFNNRVITYYYEKGWDDPSWDYTLTHNFNWPIDVDQKSVDQTQQPPEEVEYIAVVDHRNHRLVFFHGWPAPIGFDRAYGEYGSGVGQFIYPTSVCFGRDPETGWQTNDLFLTDDGNDRLVWLYLQDIGVDTVFWEVTYQFPVDAELTSVEVDNKGLVYVVDRHNAKVYKFAPLESYDFLLLGIWGEKGTADGQLYNPNVLTVAHARYCPYPNPCIPHPNPPGDVFVSESWGDSTGVRRFVIASDVVNLSATYVPYNEDTGEGNLIWYTYYLTDFADDVTEQVFRGGDVCTTYNRGSLNWGSQGGDWNVGGHPHGETYTVKITATSIYDPTIVVEKTVDVYVDTITTHNPIITRGIRCNHDTLFFWGCADCYQCIKEGYLYTIDVQAFDPDEDSLTYEWLCGQGYFTTDEGQRGRRVYTSKNYVCYEAPPPPNGQEGPPYEQIKVTVIDPYGGDTFDKVDMDTYLHSSETSCLCGDANGDGNINSADFVFILNYLFVEGSPAPDPMETAGVNNDCEVNSGDPVYLLNYLFVPGSPAPECCWIH
ncbi:MAG: dockerin type I domain-containing protein, partial [Candidatus Zixiibacteriota bacterium]